MSDLSQTILRGTDQMSEGYQSLGRVRALNRGRKDAAVRAATASLGEAAKNFNEYGSWQDAKAAEKDQLNVLNAARLGRIKAGAQGELDGVDATPALTRDGALTAANIKAKASAELRAQNHDNIAQAVETRAAIDWSDKQDEGKWTADIASKTPLRHPGMQAYFASGHGTRAEFFKAQQDEMTADKQAAQDAEKLNRQKEQNAFREKMTAYVQGQQNARQGAGIKARSDAATVKWGLNLPFLQDAMDLRHRAADNADQTLLVNATHLQNAANLDAFNAQLAGLAANNKVLIETRREAYDSAKDQLTTGLATAKEMLSRIDKDFWKAPDEENKALLREKASNIVKGLEEQNRLFKTFSVPVALGAPPAAPTLAPIPQPRGKSATNGASSAIDVMPNGQTDSGFDYDYAAAKKAGVTRAENGHLPDTYKRPWHETFSTESSDAAKYPDLAGTWSGERYSETPAHAYMMTLDDESKVKFAKLTPEQRAAVLAKVGGR